MTTIPTQGREFEVAQEVAGLLDTLTPEQQRQVMALLATRFGMQLKEPAAPRSASGYGYRRSVKRRY